MKNPHSAVIRLLLIEDHVMFRDGLTRIFAKEPGMTVVGQCSTTVEGLSRLAESGASMVLLDMDPNPERGLDFVRKARKQGFRGHFLVVTAGISGAQAVQLIQSGVAGIVKKQKSAAFLCETIRQIAAGEVYLEQDYMKSLFSTVDGNRGDSRAKLTDRDKVVLRLVFQGMRNKDIGAKLEISESGAKSALRQLFDKLRVRTRAQLVRAALEQYRDEL